MMDINLNQTNTSCAHAAGEKHGTTGAGQSADDVINSSNKTHNKKNNKTNKTNNSFFKNTSKLMLSMLLLMVLTVMASGSVLALGDNVSVEANDTTVAAVSEYNITIDYGEASELGQGDNISITFPMGYNLTQVENGDVSINLSDIISDENVSIHDNEGAEGGVINITVNDTVNEKISVTIPGVINPFTAGEYNITVDDDKNEAVNYTISMNAAEAHILEIISVNPDEITAGDIISAIEVNVTDAFNNLAAGVNVTVEEVGGYVFDGGELNQTTNASGIATFDDLNITLADDNYRLNFSINGSEDNVVEDAYVLSEKFNVAAADAESVEVVTQPENTTAGDIISAIEVNVTDTYNNLVTGVTVTVEEVGNDYELGGQLTQASNESGIATFDDLLIESVDTGYQLNFSINGSKENVVEDANATSETFSVLEVAIFQPEIIAYNRTLVEGEDLNLTANVTNVGGVTREQNVTLAIINKTGHTFEELSDMGDELEDYRMDVTEEKLEIDAGETENTSLLWEDAEAGEYTLIAHAEENDGSDGNDMAFSVVYEEAPNETINLEEGWNMVSTPREIDDADVVLPPEDNREDDMEFFMYDENINDVDAEDMEPLHGYYVYVCEDMAENAEINLWYDETETDSDNPPALLSRQLYEGWNMIGPSLKDDDDVEVSDVGSLESPASEKYYSYLWRFDFNPFDVVYEFDNFNGTEAYWIFMDEDSKIGGWWDKS